MIMSLNIEDNLSEFIQSEALAENPITRSTDLLESNILDSLLLMDLVVFVESTFHIQLEDFEISPQHFRTIDSLASLVKSKLVGTQKLLSGV